MRLEEYLTVHEVADLLRVSRQTVYAYIRDKKLNAHKVGSVWHFEMRYIHQYIIDQRRAGLMP